MLVLEYALDEEHVQVWKRCPNDLERGPKLFVDVLPRTEEIGSQRLERADKKLQAVIEHEVLNFAQCQVVLHSLADEIEAK